MNSWGSCIGGVVESWSNNSWGINNGSSCQTSIKGGDWDTIGKAGIVVCSSVGGSYTTMVETCRGKVAAGDGKRGFG
jgi:hypothetical protein